MKLPPTRYLDFVASEGISGKFRKAFERSVSSEDGCRLWAGEAALDGAGYFKFWTLKGIPVELHARRASYWFFFGDAEKVGTTCGNKLCVEPKHLKIVEGMPEKPFRAGAARGEAVGGNRIAEEVVRALILAFVDGRITSITAAANLLEVDRKTIRKIRDQETWRHVWLELFPDIFDPEPMKEPRPVIIKKKP